MNPVRWQRLQDLVEAAAALPSADRARFLAAEVPDDFALREQVGDMLSAYETSGLFEDLIGNAAAHAVTGEILEPGDRLGPWRVRSLIGHGGMGSVYRAERADEQYNQQAAIKLVRFGPGAPTDLLLRFRAERQILASISHPNIARLLDGGFTDSGLPYLVMEFVEGEPLDNYLNRARPSLRARLILFQQICAAVHHAHQNLVVHRDLKPGNILVTPEGAPRLLDFGIAKLLGDVAPYDAVQTRLTGRLMTPEYASPEQIRGEAITTATDIYSLGVVLYESLTGTRPFELSDLSPAEMERVVTQTGPMLPSAVMAGVLPRRRHIVPKRRPRATDLDRIVLKSMHKLPARRYSSASDLSADVQRLLEGFPVTARPDSFAYRSRLFIGRHRVALSAVTLVLLTIVGLTITSVILAARARREAASAESVSTFLTGLFQQARPDSTHGQNTSARELLDKGAASLQNSPVQDPLIHARLLSTLGRVYFDLGDMAPAARLLGQAESIYRQHPGQELLHLGETESSLGTLELEQSNTVAATAHFQGALTLFRRLQGPNSPAVADSIASLGEVEGSIGHFVQAEHLLQQAIVLHTRALGADADATLVDKHNLASVYDALGDYRREKPLLSDVLAWHRRTIGDLQEITASDVGNAAWLEDRLGHLVRAEALAREAISIKSRLFGATNPRLAMQYLVLADILRQAGRLPEAQSAAEMALEFERAFAGGSALHTAWDEDELGQIALAAHRLPGARTHLLAALHLRESKSPQPLPDLALSYDHLGQLELAEETPILAEGHLRRAEDIQHTIFPRPNDALASTKNDLADAFLAQGKPQLACTLFVEAQQIMVEASAGEPHPTLQHARNGLARAHCPR